VRFKKKFPSIYFFGAVCCLNFVDFQKFCRNFVVADVNKPNSRHGEQEAGRGSRVHQQQQQQQEADIGALGSC
jgi:hypothetical protein